MSENPRPFEEIYAEAGDDLDAIAAAVAPTGQLFARCYGRRLGQRVDQRPWPVSRDELAGFTRNGLRVSSFEAGDERSEPMFTVVYERC